MPEPQEENRRNSDRPSESELACGLRILDSIPDGLMILDREWCYTYVNTQAERLVGRPRSELLGKCVWDEFPFVVGTEVERQLRRAAAEQVTCEFAGYNTAWGWWYENRASPTPDGGVAIYFRDITERRRAEERLRAAEERVRLATEAAELAVWEWDVVTDRVTWENDRLYEIIGLPRTDEPINAARFMADFVHPDDAATFKRAVATTLETGERFYFEGRFYRLPGREIGWIEFTGCLHPASDGSPLRVVGIAADITDQKRAEEEIRQARDELDLRVRERTAELSEALASLERQEQAREELLRRVVTVQEEERRRISRELHDQMGQHLTALMLRLRLAKDSVGEDSPVREQLRWLEDYAAQIGQDAHRIALELRPMALDDLGLPVALANYAEEWSKRSGVVAEVRIGGLKVERLPAAVETAIYRIVQEAMTNVLKHAEASRAVITLNRLSGYVSLIVEDDGKGFDGDGATDPFAPHARLGLLGMKERAALAGGTLEIESVPGDGTSVLVRVPLPTIVETEPHE